MNVNVQGNDFCPNDCPYCEVKQNVLYMVTPPFVERECRYADICEYAVAHYKKQKRQAQNNANK